MHHAERKQWYTEQVKTFSLRYLLNTLKSLAMGNDYGKNNEQIEIVENEIARRIQEGAR